MERKRILLRKRIQRKKIRLDIPEKEQLELGLDTPEKKKDYRWYGARHSPNLTED